MSSTNLGSREHGDGLGTFCVISNLSQKNLPSSGNAKLPNIEWCSGSPKKLLSFETDNWKTERCLLATKSSQKRIVMVHADNHHSIF